MSYTGSYNGKDMKGRTGYLLHMAETWRQVFGGDTC
jgi:hypothetical protein